MQAFSLILEDLNRFAAEKYPLMNNIIIQSLNFEYETKIRDSFSTRLEHYRPNEKLVNTEVCYTDVGARVDMRTVDNNNIIREWEFKIVADYSALGQILVYVALARKHFQYEKTIRGVLAAFEFPKNLVYTVEAMNLGLELYKLPISLRCAGFIPNDYLVKANSVDIPSIPNLHLSI